MSLEQSQCQRYAFSMLNKHILATILFSILSGPTGQASGAVKPVGDLHAFSREATILASDCVKTYKLNFDLQGECKVQLLQPDKYEVALQPIALIGLWQYRDDDFKATVTFSRLPDGYAIRVDGNNVKYKDRLQIKIAQKYIASAIQEKKFEKFTTLVARPSPQIKLGGSFTETYKGAVQVYARELAFNRNSLFTQKCREVWDGLKCNISLLRNSRGETLFTDLAPTKYSSGNLILQIKGFAGWKDGTAFSSLNIQLRTQRFDRNFENFAADLDGIFRQISKLEFNVSQVAGDVVQSPVYSQKLVGSLKIVEQSLQLAPSLCSSNYSYVTGQFKGRCDVKQAWPGAIAQPANAFNEFINFANVGTFVTVSLTASGWRADFSGDERTVGKFISVEPHFTQAAATLASGAPRLFLAY
jgi:hypothetical protein